MSRPYPLAALTLILIAFASAAAAQGLLVDIRPGHPIRLPRPIIVPIPQPPASYKIKALEVNARLADQIARVQVSQTFKNTGSQQMQVCFVFPLPYDGAIDQLTLLVDGKEFEAKLLSKEEARRRYEEIVRKNQDPALLEWIGTGMFQTNVFPIPPAAERTVTLSYSQLCRKNYGLTDFLFPLSTAKYTSGPLEKLSIRVVLQSESSIKNIYSPTHDVKIDRSDKQRAVVTHDGKDLVPESDFRLFFDTGDKKAQASVVSYRPDDDEEGYFLLLASPDIKADDEEEPARKTVVFVVDRSGSMSGKKIEQAKGAAKFVLNNLRAGDMFNIVAYDSDIETFRPELEKFNDDTRKAAINFVDGLYAGGSTDIDGALRRALGMLNDSERPTYVLFLTDGLPTAGVTKEAEIAKHAEQANQVRARLFAFGVGYDVNSRLLDKLARANFGLSQYVRPNEDIETSVSAIYQKIGSPVMTGVELKIDVEGADDEARVVSRVYPKGKFDLFAGDQAVLVGRYRKCGDAKVTLRGKLGDKTQTFDFPARLVKKSDDDTNAFVAKLWATRRVGEIIDEIDLQGRNEELINELVALATEHGILTPYTSFLADETSEFRDVAGNRARTRGESQALREVSGQWGFSQRAAKGEFQYSDAPLAARGGATALSASGMPARDAFGPSRGRGTGGGGGGGFAPAEADDAATIAGRTLGRNNAVYYDAKQDRYAAAANIRQIGRKTFFQRGERWVDSAVSEEDEKQARQVDRYSREYFELVDRFGKHVAQYVAIEEPVVVKLDGQTYAW